MPGSAPAPSPFNQQRRMKTHPHAFYVIAYVMGYPVLRLFGGVWVEVRSLEEFDFPHAEFKAG